MKRKMVIIISSAVLLVAVIIVGIWLARQLLLSVGTDTDFAIESLRWAMIGSFGSWSGSVFGAIALIVSIFALWLPQRVKIAVSVSSGFMLSQITTAERIDAYIINIINVGLKPITVNNVYLHFGDKKRGDIFVGTINQNSPLQAFTPIFPKRVDGGDCFSYYLLREKLNAAIAHYEKETLFDAPLSIRIDEATKGSQYYKTKWTLKVFLEDSNNNSNLHNKSSI